MSLSNGRIRPARDNGRTAKHNARPEFILKGWAQDETQRRMLERVEREAKEAEARERSAAEQAELADEANRPLTNSEEHQLARYRAAWHRKAMGATYVVADLEAGPGRGGER